MPFCRHGFLFVPETSPTFLVLAVPLRCAAWYATTASCTACVPFPSSTSGNFTSSSPWFFPFDIFNGNFHGALLQIYFLASAGLASAFLSSAPFRFMGATLTGGFQPLGRFLDSRMTT